MADHVTHADGAILWRHLVAKEQHLGGMGIHFDHVVARIPEGLAQEDAAVDEFSDDGTLVGIEATDPHLGQLQFKQAALPVGHRKVALAGLVQTTETRGQVQGSADGYKVWFDVVNQLDEFAVFLETA